MCDAANVHSAANFVNGYPPIIIANIKPLTRRSEEGYEANSVRLRDMKSILSVGHVS